MRLVVDRLSSCPYGCKEAAQVRTIGEYDIFKCKSGGCTCRIGEEGFRCPVYISIEDALKNLQ